MTARITTTALLALMVEQNAAVNARLDALVSQGQHATPAPVAEAVKASAPTKASKKTAKKVEPKASTKVPMPVAVREGFALVKATKEAMSPLNKALDWSGANAGVKATDRPAAEIEAALALVQRDHGKAVATAARKAYKTRLAAAEARKAAK